jgi:hypothetical protein
VRTAQENATRALISKLDSGMTDRLDALLTQRVDPYALYQGARYNTTSAAACEFYAYVPRNNQAYSSLNIDPDTLKRAAVLARFEQIRHEIPDAFTVQAVTGTSVTYPLNYGLLPFPGSVGPTPDFQAVTPLGLGRGIIGGDQTGVFVGSGIWGAAYTAHAAINRNLGKWTDAVTAHVGNGIGVKGFNMVDDDSDGLIDNYTEWGGDADGSIAKALTNHTHRTARAEVLYALLVEGQGPYGSVFNRDDFTDKEVADTDRDGLPEFIDGWGNPLMFYRWPVFYHSDLQRGLSWNGSGFNAPYANAFDTREQDPLDPNQQLTTPAWWSSALNAQGTGSVPLSGGAVFFQTYFHQLTEPLANAPPNGIGPSGATNQMFWDRSNTNVTPPGTAFAARRAFYNRFLILSAGPDGAPGVPYLTDYKRAADAYATVGSTTPTSPPFYQTDSAMKSALASNQSLAAQLLILEGQAAQATLARTSDVFMTPLSDPANTAYTAKLQDDGLDDITNHNMSTTAVSPQ